MMTQSYAWLQGINDANRLRERFAELKPVKRRVFFGFSVAIGIAGIIFLLLVAFGAIGVAVS